MLSPINIVPRRELKLREGIKRYLRTEVLQQQEETHWTISSRSLHRELSTLWRSILANEEASDMDESDSDEDL